MHVSDMTGPNWQILQGEVTSTEHPLLLTMMDLTIKYPMKFQVGIHIWVLIHQVMSFTISIQLSMFHQCPARHKLQPRLPKPNQSPETFPKKQTKQRWTGPIYLPAHIYKLLSHNRILSKSKNPSGLVLM